MILCQVFWSENHLLMFLGTQHLFDVFTKKYPKRLPPGYEWHDEKNLLEEALLRVYLGVHVEFGGFYECNSHVYFPYTLSALTNLHDFTDDDTIREQSSRMANTVVRQLLMTTSAKGIANLSVSGRSFPRTRQRSKGKLHGLVPVLYCLLR